ncbi:MAG: gluconate 2-dehydrogenase subunit 3 family protein [Spongiibacteraceae bacterium]|nr:gluconate 2-dehydrogenase subunit 3 family protein [Spongiibacteraceae bacterium]
MKRRDLLKISALLGVSSLSSSVTLAMQAGVVSGKQSTRSLLTADQQKMLMVIAEHIIPRTDTPGAIDVGVPDFINQIVSSWYRDREREIFFQGLSSLDNFCQKSEGKSFFLSSVSTQILALKDQEKKSVGKQNVLMFGEGFHVSSDEETPFFVKLKELVVVGYYTSEVGSKEELAYLPMPGYYDGNYDFNKIGRQWSQ